MPPLRLGTRGSPLARVQSGLVRDALVITHGIAVEIVTIRTTGDRVQDRALAEIGGKALWTKELDRALIDVQLLEIQHVGRIDPTAKWLRGPRLRRRRRRPLRLRVQFRSLVPLPGW